MRRALVAAATTALVVLPTLPSAAHPGPLDPTGGHICRPEGGGPSDCAAFDLDAGEYHCHQEPCFTEFQRTGRAWCPHGLPVPIRSDGVGVFPVGEFTPPIRVVRLAGPGHVLEVERDIEPKMRAPQDCLQDAVLVPGEGLGPDDEAGFVGADSVRAASAGLTPLDRPDTEAGAGLYASVGALLLVLVLPFTRRRRARGYWEAGPSPGAG